MKTERIYLRELSESDAHGNYVSWMNDPKVNKFLESRFRKWDSKSIEDYIVKINESSVDHLFGICLKSNDKHIGNIKLGPINNIHGFADIGIVIGDKDSWGKGLAAEAIALIVDFAFNKLELHKLRAGCYSGNIASSKAFLKNGFKIEGRIKDLWLCDNSYQDGILMGITRDEFMNP